MRKRSTRCVGYLLERACQAWNKMLKLSFIYMKQSFAFFQLDSSCIFLPMGSRSVVWMMEFLYAAPWLFFFLQKVSGQQILQECLKNFEMIFFRFVVHIHASRKNQVQRCNEHGSQNACQHFISFFLRERGFFFSFFYKGFLFFIFIVHQIFIILAKHKQGQY